MKNVPETLVIQLARFGDFLQTEPLLAGLKMDSPGGRLTVLVRPAQKRLAEQNANVDQVLTVDLNDLKSLADGPLSLQGKLTEMRNKLGFLAERRVDRVINLNTSRPAALIGQLVQAQTRDGPRPAADRTRLETSPWAQFIMRLMPHRHLNRFNLVDLYRSYSEDAGPPAGSSRAPTREALVFARENLPPRGTGPRIGFQLGSRFIARQWPPDLFAALAGRLIAEKNAGVVLLGSEVERPLGETVLGLLDRETGQATQSVTNLMGRTDLDQLAGILAELDLLVTTDTGVMHLAAALGTPILALFMGPAFCHETGPYGAGHVILQARPPCGPCREGGAGCDDPFCRGWITPDLAVKATLTFLDGRTLEMTQEEKSRVRVYRTVFDRFGIVCRPLVPYPLDETEVTALAVRESGRPLIRPDYQTDEHDMEMEFLEYEPPEAGLSPGRKVRLPTPASGRVG